MKFKEPSRKDLLLSCSEVGPEDGADPRTFFRPAPARVTNRKALQLCDQVAQTLGFVLAGQRGDDLLRDLVVEAVVPAPNSAHLLVTLSMPADGLDPAQVVEHLQRATGLLRSEVAAAIHRRKVPLLTFHVARRGHPAR
jgi:ribosome-binding factor A